MPVNFLFKSPVFNYLKNIFFVCVLFSSCVVPKNYQKNKPFIVKNKIEVNGRNFTKDEKLGIIGRLSTQLDDSARINVIDRYFIRNVYNRPPAYDTAYSGISARNMEASMVHIGYYKSVVTFEADTTYQSGQKRVSVIYKLNAGPPTLIDTMSYQLANTELQQLSDSTINQSFLNEGKPVTKADIGADNARLVDLFRNNGYYKFTSDNLQMLGDTTIAALTTISDDPFETLRLLAEAQQQRNKPTIKLATILNPSSDTNHLKKYFINNIYIYPDYFSSESTTRRRRFLEDTLNGYTIRYRRKLFHNNFLTGKMAFKKGDIYRQDDYLKTINNFSKIGVWQSVNLQTLENKNKDSLQFLDMNVHLLPSRKFGFEANIETSYSTNSSYSLGNLLGISGNLSLQNRNLGKEGVKMTHALRAGVEFNVSKNKSTDGIINSNDIGYTNTVTIPRLVWPFTTINKNNSKFLDTKTKTAQQSFINTNLSYTNRINLFNLQSVSFALGYSWNNKRNATIVLKPLNVEFSRVYNQSETFNQTLATYPYLRYSFNTALVMGSSFSYIQNYSSPRKPTLNRLLKLNIEESGYPFLLIAASPLGLFKNYLRQFAKADIEITWTKSKIKKSHVFRVFAGIGVPIGKGDTSLPFFKQYFAGGANSMRGWPIRGIGQGNVTLRSFYDKNRFNDKTGDIKLEVNYEFRHPIAQIIPNSVSLKGAFFVDAGNIWNFKNNPSVAFDSSQFKFANLYKQLGVSAGYGFRLDFNYFLIRFDLGFRFKKPDVEENAGWQIPAPSYKKIFKRGETITDINGVKYNDERYKKWRYENFNFTVGISYPF